MLKTITFVLGLHATAFADDCLQWFKNSNVSAIDKSCILKCNLIEIDMRTFNCRGKCDQFCKSSKDCPVDTFWSQKILDQTQIDWDIKSERVKKWTVEERKRVVAALSKLPDKFRELNLRGIYRMERSISIGNPASNDHQKVVLYDRAFDGPILLEQVLAHELAHFLFSEMSSKKLREYRKELNWTVTENGTTTRKGSLVSEDGRDSIEEDFANNIEFFLFNPEKLKQANKEAYLWIEKNLSKEFRIKDGCFNEKK